MRTAIVLALTLSASAKAAAPADNLACPYDAAKFLPAFKAAVISFINGNVKFEWNQASLKISCAKEKDDILDEETCAVVFQAKDGTQFFLHDSAQCYTDDWGHGHCSDTSDYTMAGISFFKNQQTNDEGNYVGPATCEASITDPWIVNHKTGVMLPLPNPTFPTVSYQK